MDVHDLAPGKPAPKGSDRIMLKKLAEGRFGYEAIHTTGTVTHHSTFHDTYELEDEALQAALDWAERSKIKSIYVERSADA